MRGVLLADGNQKRLGAGDGGVEHAARQQHRPRLADGQDHSAVFAALRFMYRHGPGVLQLVEHLEAIGRIPFVKADDHGFRGEVHGDDLPDVAVKYAGAAGNAAGGFQ